MSAPGPAVDPDEAAWVPPRSPVPILPVPDKGILKARPPAPDFLEPEMIRGHERDPGRPTVRFTLAAGHRDRNTRGGKKRKGPSFPNSMRRGLDLYDLQARYVAVCKHLQIEPLSQILYALEDQINAGTNTPPHILDLRGVEHVNRPHSLTIAEYIVQNGSLREVIMAGIGVRDEHLEKLCQAIAFRRCIERINLSDNARIGPMGFAYIGQTLARSVFLSYLNLSGCNIKTKSAEILNIALPKSKLRTLIMHRAGMKNPKTFGLIASGCADSNSLSSVSFKSNGMSAKSIQHIQVLLGPSCILETLDLRSNLIGDGGAQILATALSTNTRLTKLILFENKISHFGATCLYQALQSNTALETLDISNNLVGRAETMDELKRFLMINSKIENLFLWKIGMDDTGCIILGEALAENRSLKRAEVRNNALTVTGYLALSHALKVNEAIFKMLIDVPENSDPDKQELGLMLYQSIQHSCGSNLLRYPVDEQEALGNGEENDPDERPLPAPANQPTRETAKAPDVPPTSDGAAGENENENENENMFEVIMDPDSDPATSLSRTNPFLVAAASPAAEDGGEPTAVSAVATAPVPVPDEVPDEVRTERGQTAPSSYVPEEHVFERRQTGPSISPRKKSNPFLDLQQPPEQLLGVEPAAATQDAAASSGLRADPIAAALPSAPEGVAGTGASAAADASSKLPGMSPALDMLIQAGLDDLSDEEALAVPAPVPVPDEVPDEVRTECGQTAPSSYVPEEALAAPAPGLQIAEPAVVHAAVAAATATPTATPTAEPASELTSAREPDSLAEMATMVTPGLGKLGSAEAAAVPATPEAAVADRAKEPVTDTAGVAAGPPIDAEPATKSEDDLTVDGQPEAVNNPAALAVQPDTPGRDAVGDAVTAAARVDPDDPDGGEATVVDAPSKQPTAGPSPEPARMTAEQMAAALAKLTGGEAVDAHGEGPKQQYGAHENEMAQADLDNIDAALDAMIEAQFEDNQRDIEVRPVSVEVNDPNAAQAVDIVAEIAKASAEVDVDVKPELAPEPDREPKLAVADEPHPEFKLELPLST